MNELRKSKTYSLSEALPIKYKVTWIRRNANADATPMIDASDYLGMSVNKTGLYYLRSFKSYTIRGVTGANWSVKVGESLEDSASKTKLTVFLINDTVAYDNWYSKCLPTCLPPTDLAYKVPICIGLECSFNVTNLDPKARYQLFVGDGPVVNPFTNQMIEVRRKFLIIARKKGNFCNEINCPNRPILSFF